MPQVNLAQALHIAATHHEAGRFPQAEDLYRRILAIQPDHPDALHLLGVIARQHGQPAAAIDLIRRSIAIKPTLADAHCNLGAALQDLNQLDDAIASYQQALTLRPGYPEAYSNLGSALQESGRTDQAVEVYRYALQLAPHIAEAHYNLATALQEQLQLDEARNSFNQAISLKPHYAQAHRALGLLLLLQGDFSKGWLEYEWRLQALDFPRSRWDLSIPKWEGSPLNGRRIFLHTEQGLGDAIQFCRFISSIARQAQPPAKIIGGCPPALKRLFETIPGVDHWVGWGEPVPPCDLSCSMLSLPLILGTDLQTIPADPVLFQANQQLTHYWHDQLKADTNLKVGLCWAGGPRPKNRSIPVSDLGPLDHLSNITFYSLQKTADPVASPEILPISNLVDRMAELNDFADTAALIQNLDLIISIDTAVLHLAGTLGKPAWGLLKFFPDARWLLDRSDSPWYPTVRLFRQQAPNQWEPVISEVAQALRQLQNVRPAVVPAV